MYRKIKSAKQRVQTVHGISKPGNNRAYTHHLSSCGRGLLAIPQLEIYWIFNKLVT
ncbi:hypothetical protein D322_441 [Yersinia enterocolitica IP 10393]|nr:hypothetical protein D322_441 [Yersinia enterocolitica IP 10393]